MPITHRIVGKQRLVASVHAGEVPDEEFLRSYERLYKDPAFAPGLNHLVDIRRAASGVRGTAALRAVAELTRTHEERAPAGLKRAIVAPGDVGFGLGRMFQTFSEDLPSQTRVFRDLDEAARWLDVEPETAHQLVEDLFREAHAPAPPRSDESAPA